ncbi:MAG: hypothetical protein WA996_02340 [Candidatus Promineifilaceae bacterium]
MVDADITVGLLISEIVGIGGPTYEFRDISPVDLMDGGIPGGNIRVGFLFNPGRATFIDRPGGDATTATTASLGATELNYPTARAVLTRRILRSMTAGKHRQPLSCSMGTR